MIGKEFNAVMTKHSFVVINNATMVEVALKYSNAGDVQSFMEPFERELKTTNIQNVFDYPVRWSKMTFDVSDYDPNYYHIEFDEIEFFARLTSIQVTRKTAEGIDTFDYTINFVKEVGADNSDAIVASTYLKHKEENEDGKMILMEYPVLVKLAEDPAKASASTDDLL